MTERPLIVVGCGFPQLGLLRAARQLGVPLVGLDRDANAVGVSLVDRFLPVSSGDPADVKRAALELDARGVTTTGSELALTTVSAVCHALGLPFYADPTTIHRCQAKDAMRSAYEAAGLPVPRFAHASSPDDVARFAAEVGLPVVVKPARGWGQRGVRRVDRSDELADAFEAADRVSHDGAGVVVEEHIVGRELSINGWVEDGELVAYSVTDREVFPGTAPLGVMRSEIVPSLEQAGVQRDAVDAARRAARSLGLGRGPCYTQVCVARDRIVVFETAARCGGGFDADVTKLVSGVDLYRRGLGVALGSVDLEREGRTAPSHPAALVRFLPPPVGRVIAVRGQDDARGLPGVIDAAIYAVAGDDLHGMESAASRIGHVIAVGADREEAIRRADVAERALEILV
jgi:S-sulfo-L-cysteine synthase (3-phospho-L-serine-dependent)